MHLMTYLSWMLLNNRFSAIKIIKTIVDMWYLRIVLVSDIEETMSKRTITHAWKHIVFITYILLSTTIIMYMALCLKPIHFYLPLGFSQYLIFSTWLYTLSISIVPSDWSFKTTYMTLSLWYQVSVWEY